MLDLASLAAATTTTTAKARSGAASSLPLLILVVAVAAYFLFIRPRTQRNRRAQQTRGTQWGVGDRIQTVGGIKGTVESIDGDDVRVEVDRGVVLTFTAQAIRSAPMATGPVVADDDAPTAFGGSGPDDDVVEEPVVVPDDIAGIDFGDSSEPGGHPHDDDDDDEPGPGRAGS